LDSSLISPSGVSEGAPEDAIKQCHPLRSDAERNRRRLVEAASQAFAECGFDVSVDEIARRAGLGKGTLFRRFPSKEDLMAEIAQERMSDVIQAGRELAATAEPGEAMRVLMHKMVELLTTDRGLAEALEGLGADNDEVLRVKHELIETVSHVLKLAQDAGQVRNDVTECDVMLLVVAISHISAPFRDVDRDMWQRYFGIIFDGLRPAAAHPCSHAAPTEEHFQAMGKAKLAGRV